MSRRWIRRDFNIDVFSWCMGFDRIDILWASGSESLDPVVFHTMTARVAALDWLVSTPALALGRPMQKQSRRPNRLRSIYVSALPARRRLQ